ncbi:MAG: hypothetical protein JWN23_1798 [Rhodocyclales bacterium]|nr:hypothetical protein [Rhodocyclales bacterium]
MLSCVWSPFVLAHTGDGFPYATVSCDKTNQRIVVSEKIAETEDEIPKDKSSMGLDGMLEISPIGEEDGVLKVKKYLNRTCILGKAKYRLIVKPHFFNNRVQGMCGAAAPSINLAVYKNGKIIMRDFIFKINCPSEGDLNNKVNEVLIDDKSLSVIFSIAKAKDNKNITIPFGFLPSLKRDALFEAEQGFIPLMRG